MKNLIIFDCFGVLTSELAPVWFGKRFEPQQAKELKERYFGNADLGGKTINELMDDLARGLNIDRAVIIREFTEIFSLNVELLNYIRGLKRDRNDCDIALLSNAPKGLVESINKKYGLHRCFDKTFVSWQYGTAKPDRRFYEICINGMGAEYVKIFMIDDNQINLKGLSEMGITPVLFTNNTELFALLDGEI